LQVSQNFKENKQGLLIFEKMLKMMVYY